MIKNNINEMIQANPKLQAIKLSQSEYDMLMCEVDVRTPLRKWKNIPILIDGQPIPEPTPKQKNKPESFALIDMIGSATEFDFA